MFLFNRIIFGLILALHVSALAEPVNLPAVYASEDAFVSSSLPRSNFGSSSSLETDRSPDVNTYLKFSITESKGAILSARLRVFVTNSSVDGPRLVQASNTWSESTLNYENRPGTVGSTIEDKGSINRGTWVTYNVTGAIKGNGTYSFVLLASSTDGADFSSSESANPPRLEIVEERTVTGPAPAPAINFIPVQNPLPDTEFVNGLRGYYRWRGQELIALPTAAQDHYDRFIWKDLEPSMDVYDFSKIDRAIALAQASNAKFGFRIRSMVGYEDGQVYVPDYLRAIGWWADTDGNGTRSTFVPDWNNPTYIARAQKLLAKLGERYANDVRISYIDVGLFGQYGEWTVSSRVNYATAPSNVTPATTAFKRTLLDAHVRAFPNTQLLMFMLYSNFDSLLYAFSLPTVKPIGTRVDCIGQQGFFNQWLNRPTVWDQIKDRWRTAPMISEYCAGSIVLDGASTRDDALGHVEDFHVSAIGNGNVAYSSLSSTDQNAFRRIGTRTGFRFHLAGLSMAGSAAKGTQVNVRGSWLNQGVAPAYENWQVVLEFRDISTRSLRWSNVLAVNLKQLMPSLNAYDLQSAITIPTGVASGQYEVSLRIVDPQGYRPPLALANSGRGASGEYVIGTFRVD